MNVKKCDRCGSIIENTDNYIEVQGDKVTQGVNGRFKNSFDIYGDLCEDCMNELKEFMKGKEEPEEEPSESKRMHDLAKALKEGLVEGVRKIEGEDVQVDVIPIPFIWDLLLDDED